MKMKTTKNKISNKVGLFSVIFLVTLAILGPLGTFWAMHKLTGIAIPLTLGTFFAFWLLILIYKILK